MHGEWSAPPARRDPVELLEEQTASRNLPLAALPRAARSATEKCSTLPSPADRAGASVATRSFDCFDG